MLIGDFGPQNLIVPGGAILVDAHEKELIRGLTGLLNVEEMLLTGLWFGVGKFSLTIKK